LVVNGAFFWYNSHEEHDVQNRQNAEIIDGAVGFDAINTGDTTTFGAARNAAAIGLSCQNRVGCGPPRCRSDGHRQTDQDDST
jgi:hypothetical protein